MLIIQNPYCSAILFVHDIHTPNSVRTKIPKCTHFCMKYQIFPDIPEQFDLSELEIRHYAYF